MSQKLSVMAAAVCAALGHSSIVRAQDSQQLEQIVVTASPITQDRNAMATLVGSVDRRQILQSGGASLADALANEPGVTGTSFAAGASRPVIRGFDANRVRVLENGIGSFDVSDVGPDHGVPIDPLSTERIELVRGAATLRYGSQAIGGVVNAINNRIPDQLPDQPIHAEVTGTYASGADARQDSAHVDGRAGDFALHADAFSRRSDDYSIPGGTQPNSYMDGNGYALGGSYFFGDDFLGLGTVHYAAKYGIPSDTTYIDMQQTKRMLRGGFGGSGDVLKRVTVDAGSADYEHSEIDPATGERLSTFKDNEWDTRVESTFKAFGPFTGLAVGAQFQNRDFSALGEGQDYLQPTTTDSHAVFAFAETPLGDKVRLQTGMRAEHVDVTGTPASDVLTSRHFAPVSASIGALFAVSDQTKLGVTFTSAARAPAQTELFARGPHDGPGTFETGDPTLREERANSLEGTLRYKTGRTTFEGALWQAKFDHYIYGDLTGRTCDDAGVCAADDSGELKELNYTQANATFVGAEGKVSFALGADASHGVSLDVLGDYVRAKLDAGGNVPRMPPYHVGLGLHWDRELFDAGFVVRYSAEQDKLAFAETPTDAFTSVDAHFGWRPKLARSGFELALVGRNLTNTVQRNAVALNKDDVILPGRDIRIVARFTF
ncbi:MAG TPA: TonB-dependent receptor [Gammaproteobacteria bacterium]|nr:TonB-dependent receptor [Gammaproteobacteria bacterium]